MRSSFLLTLACLAVNVFAGGYQGCLERVMLFYAYQIDGLNDKADQTLGFSCITWNSTTKPQTCKDNKWKECQAKGGGRCNFNELMASLGKTRPNEKLVGPPGADQTTTTPDIEETAKVLHQHYTSTIKNNIVPNYPAYKALKGSDGNYNGFLEHLGKVVNEGARHKNEGNKQLWEKFDSALDKVRVAREGDHGKFLIPAAEAKLGSKMEVKRQNLGNNPVNPSEQWQTVDWAATEDEARKKGIPNYISLIIDFKNGFYEDRGEGRIAREHLVVMESFERLADTGRSCR
ncbi:hypothetical protein FQN50_009193 [Emmonsiellopsis sp. PD_5]|nr:hypothetical protein FQN50_009193 [Emmonsiellopsis sp. PD_5]